MTEDGIQLTPLAGRVVLNKKESITGSVFLAILINIFILVLVQALNALVLASVPALFWVLTALLIAADAVLCVLVFRRAITDAGEGTCAPPYTIAYRRDGYIVLCHKNGEREYFAVTDVVDVKAFPAKLGFIVNGWAYSGNLNYGRITFYLASPYGGEPIKKSVKYVVNCAQAAVYIREVFLPGCRGENADK